MSRSPRLRAAFVPPGPLLGGDSGRPPATPLSQVLALTGHWSGGPGLPSLPAADHGTTHPPLHPAQLPPQAQLATLPLPPRRSSGLPGGSVWEGRWSPKLPLTEPAGGPRTRVHWGPGCVCIGAPDRVHWGPGRVCRGPRTRVYWGPGCVCRGPRRDLRSSPRWQRKGAA